MSITKELYDEYVKNSFFTEKNFSGKYSHTNISKNMIPHDKLSEFHYQTSFFLNFYAGLYIELKNYEIVNGYNITLFTNIIENLGIKIDLTTAFSSIYKLTDFSNKNYTFYVNTFQNHTTSQDNLYTAGASVSATASYVNTNYSDILNKNKVVFGTNQNTLITSNSDANDRIKFLLLNRSTPTQFNEIILTKSNYLSNMPDNTSKFKEILEEVFSQTPENILGYLLYKKIYYNIILFNINIQNCIRHNYLNEKDGSHLIDIASATISISTQNIINIKDNIIINTGNIKTLNTNHFIDNNNNDFLLEKNKYTYKINTLNTLRNEYSNIQDKLNISTKLYNQQFKNYKSIKTYATYIIIALILIVISIISISIFPIFSIETKNALYIILLVILIVITFLYYTNFKYVNLYENFTPKDGDATLTFDTTIDIAAATTTDVIKKYKNNNIIIYNLLLPYINEYSNAYNDLLNNMRLNNYTIGSKTFSQDANIYLYNLYLEKKRQIEINKIKLTNLFNMIEVIKKQINYLFNIIFFIACFSIILLVSLVIYSTAPQLYLFVIILCVILISILMIYFTFAIVQPTRMIANKNYWAIINPSKTTFSKL